MSESQDKAMRREVRSVLRQAGMLPEQYMARKPKLMPAWLWTCLYNWLMHGKFARRA